MTDTKHTWTIPQPERMGRHWAIKIPVGQWMTGVHRFSTKTRAQAFADEYKRVSEKGVA